MLKTKEAGITLVALVITIIVVLILAGISVSMIAGDNGVLTQAVNASDEMNLANIKSDLELALANCQTSYYEARFSGGDKDVTNYFTTDLINEGMGEGYTVSGSITVDTDSTLTIKINEKTYKATVHVTSTGKVENMDVEESDGSVETFADVVTSDNYGDYVNYSVDLNYNGDYCDDWRIFYNDGENVFIIAADCITENWIPLDDLGAEINSDNVLVFSGKKEVSFTLDNADSKFKFSDLTAGVYDTSSYNYVATSALLDCSLWSDYFLDSEGLGLKAIGSPTLEMFIESWNDCVTDWSSLWCAIGSSGYRIGYLDDEFLFYVGLFESESRVSDLFFVYGGYWLSSPNGAGATFMYFVGKGALFGMSYNDFSIPDDDTELVSDPALLEEGGELWTLRPVVMLDSSCVIDSVDSSGSYDVWNLSV